MRTFLLCVALLILVLLGGCGETSSFPINQPVPPTGPETPPSSGGCTYVLNDDITVPTQLVNTASACDYQLEGYVYISSRLVIEPGVVIQASQDSGLTVDGGELLAVGDAQNRIVLEGLNHVAGYWGGVDFNEGRESRLEYVDIKDAGQVCGRLWCSQAGLVLSDVTISLTNSSVSNSYVHGVSVDGNVLFTAFANNRFYGNTWSGIYVSPEYVPFLDAGSDYLGQESANGLPYVYVGNGDLVQGVEDRWQKLNAPYLLVGYVDVQGGILAPDPGVTLVFDEGSWLDIEGNGVLRAVGTAAEPIVFKGKSEVPGYWDGITFWGSPWQENVLEYVDIRHGGSDGSLSPAYGAVYLYDSSSVTIRNSVIADNARYAVNCSDPTYDDNVLVLGSGNTFSNNALGDIDPECGVTP